MAIFPKPGGNGLPPRRQLCPGDPYADPDLAIGNVKHVLFRKDDREGHGNRPYPAPARAISLLNFFQSEAFVDQKTSVAI